MKSNRATAEPLLRRRRYVVNGLVTLTVVVLLGIGTAGWLFLDRMGRYLEDELGRRLGVMAALTARLLESYGIPDRFASGDYDVAELLARPVLEELDERYDIEGAHIIDRQLSVLTTSQDFLEFGAPISYLIEDSLALVQVWRGEVSVGPLHLVEGNRFKTAYAPLRDSAGGISAAVVVEANADFFALLAQFRQGLIFGALAGLLLLSVFAFLLYWAVAQLLRTQESLRRSERLAAMGQMAAAVAHEIRNPLSIIKGTADVLRERYNRRENPDELFEFIPTEVRRLNRLVNDFLTFARDPALDLREVDIAQTVRQTIAAVEDEFRKSGVQLTTDDIPSVVVRHDADALHQVLLNLLLNAQQAVGNDGEVRVSVQRDERRGRGGVRIEVSDTGPGLPDEPEQVFEPFYTTKATGSGLGLAICRLLVEKQGGEIQAKNRQGGGSVFEIFLPME